MISRRQFTQAAAVGAAGLALRQSTAVADHHHLAFRISLAQWSLHRTLQSGKMDNLQFAGHTKKEYGIEAVEYVNQFFKDKAKDKAYINEMKQRAEDAGVKNLLIMCDGEGRLGDPNLKARVQAVENHFQWVEAAKQLGCHSIRVNAASEGSYDDQSYRAADGLRALTEFASDYDINVIVENHGGLSSNGAWLAKTIQLVGHLRCGTLPDFGNFQVGNGEMYDRYKGVTELMPFAKAVSAKSHDFDDRGNEKHTNYRRMMKIVLDAGYDGWVGIEYEGGGLSEVQGIHATKKTAGKSPRPTGLELSLGGEDHGVPSSSRLLIDSRDLLNERR